MKPTTNFKAFNLQLDRFVERFHGQATLVLRRCASKLGEAVTVGNEYGPGTPVDTGFARANWWASLTIGGAPTDGLYAAVAEAAVGDTIYFLNGAEYIGELEKGHSPQAPFGMVGIVIDNAAVLVDRVVKDLNS